MRKSFTALAVMTVLMATWAAPAVADVEDAIEDGEAGVRLLTPETAAVTRGDDVWVMLNWTAFGDVLDAVDDFEVTLRKEPPNGVIVQYPANTVDHTSLWDDNSLSVGEVDYTALNIIVDAGYNRSTIKLRLNVAFTVDGETFRERHNLEVPVVSFSGTPVEQVTHDWGAVTQGTAGWYEIAFAGNAPAVEDFAVVVSEPAGVGVIYPQTGFTSLHFDAVLESRETDVVRVYLETASMSPGQHTFDVECTYTFNGDRITERDTVTLEITAP